MCRLFHAAKGTAKANIRVMLAVMVIALARQVETKKISEQSVFFMILGLRRWSWWRIWYLHSLYMGSITEISEIYASSIFHRQRQHVSPFIHQ